MGVLLFLRTAFVHAGIARASRCAFRLRAVRRLVAQPQELNLAFRKTDAPVLPRSRTAVRARGRKVRQGLGLGPRRMGARRLWWNRRSDQAGRRWMLGKGGSKPATGHGSPAGAATKRIGP